MPIWIDSVADSLPRFFAENQYSSIVVLLDEHTRRHCYPLLKNLLPKHRPIEIKSGEAYKNLKTCEVIWAQMTQAHMDRKSLLLNVGGGVIGDMGGFCAATYKRGIDFVQVPTTLLSQVDASVGGKLGIDFQGLKNHIGVFNTPKAVLIDPVFLQTLSPRELRSGFAEIIKHCLIADANKWEEIRQKELSEQNLTDLIAHSVAIKENIVTADPTEKGLRKILNFGHTLGHAIETYFLGKGKLHLLHGEAIAAGMIAEAYLSERKGLINKALLMQIEEYLFTTYGKVNMEATDINPIVQLTLQDKKNVAGQVRFSLLNGVGNCTYDIPITKTEMGKALLYYKG